MTNSPANESALVVELQLLSPTVIARRPTAPGQVTRSPDYLTGTVLRGGIAGLWREQIGAEKEPDFQAIFVQGEVHFGNAWPYRPNCRTWIVPQTAATEKNGGWFAEGDEGVSDLLTRLLRHDEPDDMGPVTQVFVSENTRFGTWEPLEARRRLISRTALASSPAGYAARGVAASGRLYSFEALETGERLLASIRGPKAHIATLKSLLANQPEISVGQGRSRGLGLLRLTLPPVSPTDRLAFEEQTAAIRSFSALAGSTDDTLLLPVTLEADTILRDNYLLACSSADPQHVLARYHPGVPASMRLVYAQQRTQWIGGWEQIRRLPRAPQLVINQGSVWVFAVDEAELAAALNWWNAVQDRGLGERRAEGFGQLRLLHPFHDYRDAEEDRRW